MEKKLLFSSTATQKRVAVLEDNAVVEYIIEQPDNCRALGNIYRGRVENIVPSIQSAFIDIGLEKNAFLNVADIETAIVPDFSEDEDTENTNESEEAKDTSKGEDVDESEDVDIENCYAIENLIQEGQELLVQVSKEPIGDKCPKVTTKISIAGRFLVLVPDSKNIGVSKKSDERKKRKRLQRALKAMLPENMGCIIRTIGLDVDEELIYNELKLLVGEWELIQQRSLESDDQRLLYKEQNVTTQAIRDLFSKDVKEVIVDDADDYKEIVSYLTKIAPEMNNRVTLYTHNVPIFDFYNIERDLDKSLRRKVWLKSGGYLFFDKTEALLAIDVNSGRNNSESNLEDTVFATNMEAAKEIARQLRLRDIGGIIVVDFIDMKKAENRVALQKRMHELLKNDSTVTDCSDLSRFGLIEMTRKRVRPGINELMTEICPSCYGLGRVFSTKTIASKIDRWLHRAQADNITSPVKILVSQPMFEYIKRNDLCKQFGNDYNVNLRFEISSRLEQDEFEIYIAGQSEHITEKHL
ncbi:MAG: Rne/Rng family ribonuclease [Chitinispirillales bacterium]|jgi:ribonuclease G|nr:Rne/Rng family ribonuclease [Chitinispirillales bacterium]